MLEEGRGDAEGDVADDLGGLPALDGASEVEPQDVARDDLDSGPGEAARELRGERAVDLDEDEVADATREVLGEGSRTRADLDDFVFAAQAQRVDDSLLIGRVGEKVLP